MDPHRFGLEVRAVLVSWRAAARAVGDDGDGREALDRRALDLLDDIEKRYLDGVEDGTSRSHLERAREEISGEGTATG